MTIQDAINNTNAQIVGWYKNAEIDYNVIGSGKAYYNKSNNEVVVDYVENGVEKTWSMAFYEEYLENGINWIYYCWSELA